MKPSPSSIPASRRIVPDTRLRDTLIGVAAGAAVLGLVLYAVFYFSRQADATGGITGVIERKEFVAQTETQVSVGKGGLSSRQIAGEYAFEVKVSEEGGRVYKVFVNKADYDAHHEGERYYFIRPRPEGGKAP